MSIEQLVGTTVLSCKGDRLSEEDRRITSKAEGADLTLVLLIYQLTARYMEMIAGRDVR
jgi:hypothetical protein